MSTFGHKYTFFNANARYSSSDSDEYKEEYNEEDDDEVETEEEEEESTSDDDYDIKDDIEFFADPEAYYRKYHNKPEYIYPEQPYKGPPIVPKPSDESSSSKLRYYILSPISDIVRIYIKFAILAIVICLVALWYTVYYGDLDSVNDKDEDDADTCPASFTT